MRVVVWNVANKSCAFDPLSTLDPDVALLNEASPPASASGLWRSVTEGRDGTRTSWSVAVLSPHPVTEVTEARPTGRQSKRRVPFVCSRPGSWIAATVEMLSAGPVTPVALYGLLDEFADSSVHRSVSELSPVFDDPRYKQHVMLGGDLNVWTGWAANDPFLARDRNVLQRFEALGLVDCLAVMTPEGRLEGCPCTLGDQCTHTRTRRDPPRPDVPYQNDYLWSPPALAKRLRSCQALAGDEWFSISDHARIVAEFDLR